MISSDYRPKSRPLSSLSTQNHEKDDSKHYPDPSKSATTFVDKPKRVDSAATRKARKVRLATQRVAERRKHRAKVVARKQAANEKQRKVRFDAIIKRYSVGDFVVEEDLDVQIKDSWDEQTKKEETFISSVHEYEMLACMMEEGEEKEVVEEQIKALRDEHKKDQEHFLLLINTLMQLRDAKKVQQEASLQSKQSNDAVSEGKMGCAQDEHPVADCVNNGDETTPSTTSDNAEAAAQSLTSNKSKACSSIGQDDATVLAENTSDAANQPSQAWKSTDHVPSFSQAELQATVERIGGEKQMLLKNVEQIQEEVKSLQSVVEDQDAAIIKLLEDLKTNRLELHETKAQYHEEHQHVKQLELEINSLKKELETKSQQTTAEPDQKSPESEASGALNALERKLADALQQIDKISAEKEAISKSMDRKLMKAMSKRDDPSFNKRAAQSDDATGVLQKDKEELEVALLHEKETVQQMKEELEKVLEQSKLMESRNEKLQNEIQCKEDLLSRMEARNIPSRDETAEQSSSAVVADTETVIDANRAEAMGTKYNLYRETLHDSYKIENDIEKLHARLAQVSAENLELRKELSEHRRTHTKELLSARTTITDLEDQLQESKNNARRIQSDRAFPMRPHKGNRRTQRMPFQVRENV